MKNLKLPTAYTILVLITGLAVLLTWIIPAGKYDSLKYDSVSGEFVRTHFKNTNVVNEATGEKEVSLEEETSVFPATQKTLKDFNINIPLNKFTSGEIKKPVSIPNSYSKLESQPQGIAELIKAPIKGITNSAGVMLFVLVLGGVIGIMNYSKAFDAGISKLADKLKGKEYLLIIIVTFLIALGGTTFGLAEEIVAFIPILVPVFLRARYDAIVTIACVFVGSSVGTMCSTTNMFSVIIASDASGITWTTGLMGRILMFIVCTAICIIYIIRYGKKVQEDPKNSLIYDQKEEIEKEFGGSGETYAMTGRMSLMLIVFALCFVVMIYGVSSEGWWYEEMTALFLVGSILIGVISGIGEQKFVREFINGAKDLLGVTFIIGIAGGVGIIMEAGLISDSILNGASSLTDGMNKGIFVNALLYIYGGLSFFVPSSSGMAVLTMPIMSPLADTVGIGRDVIVNAYQYGMGLFAFINPTGLVLIVLGVVKVGYNKWMKFVLPLVAIITVITMLFLTVCAYL